MEVWRQSKCLEAVEGFGEVEGFGGGRRLQRQQAPSSGGGRELWEAAAPVWRRQRGLETYAAHRILVTHPPLPAIHPRPGIHLQLHLLPAIKPLPGIHLHLHLLHAIDLDLNLLPAIQLHLLPANQLLPAIYFLLAIHLGILPVI